MSGLVTHDIGPRSLLFVPGDRARELLPKALRGGADAVVVDLEDSISVMAKDDARREAVAAISRSSRGTPMYVRVNGVGTRWFADDVAALDGLEIAGVMLPMTEDPRDVRRIARHLRADCPVIALIETPAGVLAAPRIAADAAVIGIAFGAVDFALQMGIRRTAHGRELLFARSQIVLAARAAGVWAIDAPCTDLAHEDRCRREAQVARSLGFTGKLLIHPDQVRPVHEAFAPSPSEIQEAQAVVDAFDKIESRGAGVGTHRGQLVEGPVADAAKSVLRRANRVRKSGTR